MRNANRSLVLDTIRKEGPISRNRIAQILKLSVPTVLRIVDGLKGEYLVQEIRDQNISRGHPQSLIELNSDGYALIGIDLGGVNQYGTVTDLKGRILNETTLHIHSDSSEENLEQLCRAIDTLLSTELADGQKIRGIGIGVRCNSLPEGIVNWAPSLHWRDMHLKDILTKRFNLPIYVENDANLAVIGEMWFGEFQRSSNIVYISIGTGIGAGVIINGTLYRGKHFSVGEIGYILPGREFLGKRYDQFGALEYLASCGGIESRAQQLIKEGKVTHNLDEMTAEMVFSQARLNIPWALDLVNEMVDYLAISLTAVIGILDPEVIILNGGESCSADLLIDPIKKRLEGLVPIIPPICLSRLGKQVAALGAVMMVVDGTTKY